MSDEATKKTLTCPLCKGELIVADNYGLVYYCSTDDCPCYGNYASEDTWESCHRATENRDREGKENKVYLFMVAMYILGVGTGVLLGLGLWY